MPYGFKCLATEWIRETAAFADRRESEEVRTTFGSGMSADEVLACLTEPQTETERALLKRLQALPRPAKLELVALMYLGRDALEASETPESAMDYGVRLFKDEADDVIGAMLLEKSPLGRYLRTGLERTGTE